MAFETTIGGKVVVVSEGTTATTEVQVWAVSTAVFGSRSEVLGTQMPPSCSRVQVLGTQAIRGLKAVATLTG